MKQQTTEDLYKLIAELEQKIIELETKIYEPTDIINPVIPLMEELLSIKVNESREAITNALLPILDDVIKQKIEQDPEKMAAVFSSILPLAIMQKIDQDPQKIAVAIAPEIALAIKKQVELEKESIAISLGPEMGKAIKKQIEYERDAMVDALYPVIGSTISKYISEAIVEINQKVENNLSFEGINRKIKATIQGVSEAELIFKESIKFKVEAIFLIQKNSGLIIREIQSESDKRLESELLAGMLTAIRSFANDCMIEEDNFSELNEIEYSDFKIIMEVAGYCYLAIIIKGEASKTFLKNLRSILSEIVLKYGKEIEDFEGDSDSINSDINPLLEGLITIEKKEKKDTSFNSLMILIIVGLMSIFIPWGIIQYKSWIAEKTETEIAIALDEIPELSVYRITPKVKHKKLILTGKVPNEYLREKAAQVANKLNSKFPVNNQIIAIKIPPDPILSKEEVKRTTLLFNQKKNINLYTSYENYTIKIKGFVSENTNMDNIIQGFQNIPGVDSVISEIKYNLPIIESRIYFDFNSITLNSVTKIKPIQKVLENHPLLHLKITGYTDSLGKEEKNQTLALKRAKNVQDALIKQGINPTRLHISGSIHLPPNVDFQTPLWESRCVVFELFIPKMKPEKSP